MSRNEKVTWSFSSTFIVRFALPLNNCSVGIQFHLMAFNAIHTFWSAFQVNFFKMLQVCCISQSTIYKSSTVVISLFYIDSSYVSFHYAPNNCKLNTCLIQSGDFCSCCFIWSDSRICFSFHSILFKKLLRKFRYWYLVIYKSCPRR